ncbi:glycoside-pentoside-hexuronide (GPH):cation symporter [Niallia taxi]|uniref:glycoside-pentoside-hexuronide (GPH):cation symporter n=1 Tax=Niallia taxi TaxID=2499688 RepID=UPI00203B3505|nr:glycoside-pentoside-hexuronide (GPH):cation symporter [Niallia taxi]MCM3213682.1 glycoside-pentoside-hexuronide (GPH):cation symporter [Niallia taxi]
MGLREQDLKKTISTTNQKMSMLEKISYALGDTGSNLIYTVLTTYLTFYFTDVYGIGAAAVGTLMLVARLVDMIDSPILGILIDKTNTKWGKSRPWILWSCFPFTIVSILLFMGPELSASGKLAYVYVFYITANVLYAAVNNPLQTMLPSMTNNVQERTVANTFRMFGGQIGGLIVNLTLLPLVAYLGAGNQQTGFFYTMIIFSVVALVLFLITFFNTRERVQSASGYESIPVKESIKAIKGNRPWLGVVLFGITFYTLNIMRLSAGIYYMTYYINKPEIISIVNTLAMSSLLGVLAIPFLTKKFSKKSLIITGLSINIVGHLIIFMGGSNVTLIIIGTIIGAIGLGLPTGLLFVLKADTVDYGEWKSGVRAPGILVSASGVANKLGSGLGGAIPVWLLAAGGYIANQTQSSATLNMIALSYIWLPMILSVVAILVMIFIYKWEKPHEEIMTELEARRAQQ